MMEANIIADGHLTADKLLYAARAKLDNLGSIKAHSCIVNDPTRIKRMQEQLQVHDMCVCVCVCNWSAGRRNLSKVDFF